MWLVEMPPTENVEPCSRHIHMWSFSIFFTSPPAFVFDPVLLCAEGHLQPFRRRFGRLHRRQKARPDTRREGNRFLKKANRPCWKRQDKWNGSSTSWGQNNICWLIHFIWIVFFSDIELYLKKAHKSCCIENVTNFSSSPSMSSPRLTLPFCSQTIQTSAMFGQPKWVSKRTRRGCCRSCFETYHC